MTDPTWDGKVAGQVFRELRDMTSGVVTSALTLRQAVDKLQEDAEQSDDEALKTAVKEISALTTTISLSVFTVHDIHALLALLDLDEVRQRLGVPYQATKKSTKQTKADPRATQEVRREKSAKTK